MSELYYDCRFTLIATRCFDCGKFYALEHNYSGSCPYCAKDRANRHFMSENKLERSIRSLKGAITKLKQKRA